MESLEVNPQAQDQANEVPTTSANCWSPVCSKSSKVWLLLLLLLMQLWNHLVLLLSTHPCFSARIGLLPPQSLTLARCSTFTTLMVENCIPSTWGLHPFFFHDLGYYRIAQFSLFSFLFDVSTSISIVDSYSSYESLPIWWGEKTVFLLPSFNQSYLNFFVAKSSCNHLLANSHSWTAPFSSLSRTALCCWHRFSFSLLDLLSHYANHGFSCQWALTQIAILPKLE